MSVCFFVNADQAGSSSATEDGVRDDGNDDVTILDGTQQIMEQFWGKVIDDMRNVTAEDFKTQALPLARIKKIMKLDEDVKMISAEAPVLFAKAAEIFIHELTLRAWQHTEDNKRRTLQRNDIAMAISKSDQFDFLIDIVPRHEVKSHKAQPEPVRTQQTHTEQVSQPQHATTLHTQPQLVLQPTAQIVQQAQPAATTSAANTAVSTAQPVILQQVVTDNAVQNLPIQLTPAQINMIRMQLQNNPNQPIIIQTQQNPTPQIIQVSSQGQPQPHHQVFLTQVTTSQEDS